MLGPYRNKMREARDLKGIHVFNKELLQKRIKKADYPIFKDEQKI